MAIDESRIIESVFERTALIDGNVVPYDIWTYDQTPPTYNCKYLGKGRVHSLNGVLQDHVILSGHFWRKIK